MDYFSNVLGSRNDMIALMVRMESEFTLDDHIACQMNLCHFWNNIETKDNDKIKNGKKNNTSSKYFKRRERASRIWKAL